MQTKSESQKRNEKSRENYATSHVLSQSHIEGIEIGLQNKFAFLDEHNEVTIGRVTANLISAIGNQKNLWEKPHVRTKVKTSQNMKEVIANCKNLKVSCMADEIEQPHLLKRIYRCTTNDIHSYILKVSEETLHIRGSLKETTKKLADGNDKMYALRDK